MKPAAFELRSPAGLDDALAQLAALGSDAQVLAGGQSLLPLLRYRVLRPHVLLDINRIATLAELQLQPEGVRIGALVRHATLEQLPAARPPALAALLAAHARDIAFWAVRNRGTAVGSLVQADPKGDWPLLFCALDACIELRSLRGRRSMAVRDFILGPLHTARAVDELATAITVPPDAARLLAWGRSKRMHRAGEYALCAAVALQRADGWDCWMGAAGDKPCAMPTLARAMAQASAVPRARLLEAAHQDVAHAWPELNPMERQRHAVNAVDACAQALLTTP